MSDKRSTCDTNILFYSLDASNAAKQAQASLLLQLMMNGNGCLLLQTLGELCNSIARKRPHLLSPVQRYLANAMNVYPIIPAGPLDISQALAAHNSHMLPFWDAMIWATAKRAGCNMLFSEDFQDGRALDGVTFSNPFAMTPQQLAALFA